MVTSHIRRYNINRVRAWLEGKMQDEFLVECWNYWSSGSLGKLYAILNEETRQQDTKPSRSPIVSSMDTNEDKQISREELKAWRKAKEQ